jgi:2-oxoglutarate ferredoxin oxidoreductase subunit alpha
MSDGRTTVAKAPARTAEEETIVNDFSMVIATVNGSGSQTANMTIIRALFRMGVPVSGKNLFPSNIQGLPTWFTVRASDEGYLARRDTVEILIAMNDATFHEDLRGLIPGGVCYYPDDTSMDLIRDDVTYYPMPVKEIIREVNPPRNLRDYMKNMVYVGAVAELLGIEREEIRSALKTHFGGRQKPIDLNMQVVDASADWAANNLTKVDPYRVERRERDPENILVDGNTAAALGAIYGGVTFAAWYPITPASSLADALTEFLPKLRRDKVTNKATYTIVQAEDELSAIGMAVGAGWAGARAMTSTSGPGISLMAEFAGMAYYAEVPIVVWDIQRMGPSTGLPTRTSQGDLLFVRFLGHGDTNNVILLPGSPAECFEFGWRAFDLAERLQAPIFVLSDLDLGMNLWISKRFEYPDTPMDRGKVLSAEDLDRVQEFARYKDVDGDGIPYRTLPGTDHPNAAYFTRGSGHDEYAHYSERPEDYVKNMERLGRKYRTARHMVPAPVVDHREGGEEVGLIAFGSTDRAVQEARDRLEAGGMVTDYLRLRAVPFNSQVEEFVQTHERVYVIEMNTDGQMRKLLQLEYPGYAVRIKSLAHNDGLPLSARSITDALLEQEGIE